MRQQQRSKIQTLQNLSKICNTLKRKGKTIGLITGCFDVIHVGHTELFKFAKENCDVLIVGLDNDTTIRLSKGPQRPIFSWIYRARCISELEPVDFIFKITDIANWSEKSAVKIYDKIYDKLKPDALFTRPSADRFWKNKRRGAKNIGSKFIPLRYKMQASSTAIIEKLEL